MSRALCSVQKGKAKAKANSTAPLSHASSATSSRPGASSRVLHTTPWGAVNVPASSAQISDRAPAAAKAKSKLAQSSARSQRPPQKSPLGQNSGVWAVRMERSDAGASEERGGEKEEEEEEERAGEEGEAVELWRYAAESVGRCRLPYLREEPLVCVIFTVRREKSIAGWCLGVRNALHWQVQDTRRLWRTLAPACSVKRNLG